MKSQLGIFAANVCVFDLDTEYEINTNEFLSKGRCTPYEGKKVFGRCITNTVADKIVHLDEKFLKLN